MQVFTPPESELLTNQRMPLDASDRIRRIQETTIFTGQAIAQQTAQPNVDVSSCKGYTVSTIHKFPSQALQQATEEGRVQFSTCQASLSPN